MKSMLTAFPSKLKIISNTHKSNFKFSSKVPELPLYSFKPQKYTGPSHEEVTKIRAEHVNPGIFLYYKNPIMLVEGNMQYLFDEKGKRYLDMFAGIVTVSVGHSHPRIVKVATDQISKIMHTTTIYLNPEMPLFCKELAAKLPKHLNSIFVVNSGSDANELAMLMSRLYTGNNTILSLRNGYHGMNGASMELTNLSTWKYNVSPKQGIEKALCPDLYRGTFQVGDKYTAEEATDKYVEDLQNVISFNTSGQVAAFFAEPIQGVGGTVPMPEGYLKRAYEIVRKHGGVCIADEVQTGFGRCGTHFWGFEKNGCSPDIVTMAKGIGNGAPLAAVATTQAIAETLKRKITFNTYGGNPVSCAIGRETLKIIEDEKLQENSLVLGKYFKEKLHGLQKKHEIIGDVRGEGLMIGVELIKNRKTKEPNNIATNNIFERTKDMGLLIGKGGLNGNVFRIKPPMCINKNDVDFCIDVLDLAFDEEKNGKLKWFH